MDPVVFSVPRDESEPTLAEILSEIYDGEEVHDDDIPGIPMAERLEYALCAYHKALEDYETQPESSTQKTGINRPKYRGFARLYHVFHTTLRRRYKGETKKA